MTRIINFQSFNVFTLEKEVWDYGYHNHNFYEIILIETGKGKHRLNDVIFDYKKGDFFLLTPADQHEFVIEKKTKFIYIKFTEIFLDDLLVSHSNKEWKNALMLLISKNLLIREFTITDKQERLSLFYLAKMVLYEFLQKKSYSQEILADLFLAMLTIMMRNIDKANSTEVLLLTDDEKIEKLLTYIRINSFDKELMTIQNLAQKFLMSPNYISIFVKKHTGLSIQNHVLQYKIKAAEKLLKQSQYNINEISFKLGFNDASHFNKIFKKNAGVSPLQFRSLK